MTQTREQRQARYRDLVARRLCIKCSEPARPGGVCCERCAEANRRREAKRQEAARQSGLCIKCKVDKPTRGSVCDGCLETKRLKYTGCVDAGVCGRCGGSRTGAHNTCERCRLMNRTAVSNWSRRRRRVEARTCPMCGGAKSVSGMHCRQCSLMIKGSIAVVGAMLQNGWASLADIAREASISVRGVYRAVDRINSSGGEVQVRYVWNGKANVAMLNLVKTPDWYHP